MFCFQRLKTISYIVMLLSGSASLFMVQLVKNYLFEIIQIHWQVTGDIFVLI